MLHAVAALCAAMVTGNTTFDHTVFDRLLKAHVVDGLVDYDAFARAPEFPRYLDQLARARPETLSPKEQLAYWINVYNAYTIQLVNAHDEPRIHFALVCAARSCPPLRREAYTGERLAAQLDDQARIFIAQSPDKNRVDVPAAIVFLSPIFTWFKDDFGPDLGRFLARYVPDGPARRLLESGRFEIVETPYDWSLNSTKR